ncbi:MAG TPA: ABC transporter substrate-binding protein, partial [Thermoplasmata archaeon]
MKKNTLYAIVGIVIALIVVGAVVAIYLIPPPARPSVLVVGTTEREETLDPADAYNYMSVNLLQNTMATLLTYSQTGDGSLEPMLLTEVPTVANGGISSDGLTYTLRLRSGATFEDGTAITTTTVKYSIDRSVKAKFDPVAQEDRLPVPSFLLDAIDGANAYFTTYTAFTLGTATQAQVDSAWTNYTQRGVEVVDASTVRIHMGRVWSPMALMLAFTSVAPVNPNVFTVGAFKPQATDISASGPYKVDTFVPDERGELVRNTAFFGTPAVMERVVIRFYSDAPALALAMRSWEIDIAYRNLNPEDFNEFSADAAFRADAGSSAVIRYIVFNNQTAKFSDVRVRRALAYAIDRDSIVETAFLNSTAPLYSLIPEGMFGHVPVFDQRYQRNLATAQALLTDAGYDSGSNKLSFTLWYTPSRYGTTEADVAQLIKIAWEATGMVSVTLNSQEWETYRVSFRTGTFEIFLLGWFPDYLDPDNYVTPFLHYSSGGTASFGSWYQNDTLDDLIELQATQGIQSTARAQTLADIQDALADDVPYLPLWQTTQQVVYRPA